MQNLTSSILRSYMAKWSFPYNSPFANTSKLLLPISDVVNSNIEKCANLIAMRYRNNNIDAIDRLYSINTYGRDAKLIGEYFSIKHKDGTSEYSGTVELKNVGNYDDLSFMQFSIKGCSLEYKSIQAGNLKSFKANIGETILDYTFPSESFLYVKLAEDLEEESTCWIYGNDINGNILIEELRLLGNTISFETTSKYKTLFKVVSSSQVEISSYLDLEVHHSVESYTSFPKRIANKDGELIMPYLEIDDLSISIYEYGARLKNPLIHFDTDSKIKKAFLTGSMDIVALDDNGWVVSYKPEHMVKDMHNINGSLNSNRCLYVDEEKSKVGESIPVTIYPYKLSSVYQSTQLKISVENDGTVLYLNSNGTLTTDSNTWIKVSDMNEIVRMKVPCDNKLPYIFRVITDSGEEIVAASYQDESNVNHLCGDVEDLILINQELYIKQAGEFYLFNPRRMISMNYGENYKVTDAPYEKGDIVWVFLAR